MAEYIEKQAAIDAINHELLCGATADASGLETAYDLIHELKPADVRPVIHGHWIPVTNGRGGHECSVCHNYAPSYQSGNEYLSRFCPVCGSENNGPNQ